MKVMEVDEKKFDEVIKGDKVVIDCYASWCGPCKMLAPIIEELANEIDYCQFYKLNVDEVEEIPARFGIMSIPTILYFEKGELKNKTVGFKTKEELISLIK